MDTNNERDNGNDQDERQVLTCTDCGGEVCGICGVCHNCDFNNDSIAYDVDDLDS